MADGASVAAAIIASAKGYLGTPYVLGGSQPGGFDCSGLVQYVYGKAGIPLPRVTFDQINSGIAVDSNNAAPGDLVFFDETGADAPGPGGSPWGHVGIYLGNGMMLDAPNPSSQVRIESIQGFSPVGRYTFRRVIPNYAGTGDTGVTNTGISSALLASAGMGSGSSWDDSSIAASLGLSKSLFDSDPELSAILSEADAGGWDPSTPEGQARFTAALQNTQWYKTKTDQQRKWEILAKSDPAEARQQFVSSLGTVAHTAASMGVHLTQQQEWVLASQNAQFGWTDDELKYGIAAHFQANKTGFYGGDAGKIADDIREQASNYGMPVSAAAVGYSVYQVLNGKATQEDYLTNMKNYAMSMFPAVKDEIAAGKTLKDVAQPYLQVYQNTLEASPDEVNLAKDPTIRKAFSYVPPVDTSVANSHKQTPAPQLMPLWQYEQTLKDDPRWLKTDNAQQSLVGATVQAVKDLGLSA
jgi:hypothetical protein